MEPRLVGVPDHQARPGVREDADPTPKLIDELVRENPKGRLATVNQLQGKSGPGFDADITCPLTAGIFLIFQLIHPKKTSLPGRNGDSILEVLKEGGNSTRNFREAAPYNPSVCGRICSDSSRRKGYMGSEGFREETL